MGKAIRSRGATLGEKEKTLKGILKEPIFNRRFDYPRELVANHYLRELEKGIASIEEAEKKSGYTPGYPSWNLLYYCLYCTLRKDKFNIILETGTNWGCSTIVMAQALKDCGYPGKVYSVEIDQENYNIANNNINKSGIHDLVELYHGNSIDFLRNFSYTQSPSLIFLDGDHSKKTVVEEFDIIYNHIDHKTIVFFDNTYLIDPSDGRVNAALKYIKTRYGGNLINLENTSYYTPGNAIWQMDPFRDDWAGDS